MGHVSITVTAHTCADLFDEELDDITAALSPNPSRQIHGGEGKLARPEPG